MRMPIAILATLALLACREQNDAGRASARSAEPAAEASAATPAALPAARPLVTVRANDAEVLSLHDSGDTVDVAYAGYKLRGEARDSGKRKYSVDGGPVSWEVKPNEEGGFKLRTADGRLRWKVKVSDDKIKISDNEENRNPFELKMREGNRVKVVAPGGKELGNVRFDGSRIEVENAAGQTQFTIATATPSAAFGVLLLDDIPPQERAILAAELLSRGR